eukprot:scaffold115084_cov33-Phaeocystis_antarctica.AAC.1
MAPGAPRLFGGPGRGGDTARSGGELLVAVRSTRNSPTCAHAGAARAGKGLRLLVGLRCPATEFEQVCGAAQAALKNSRVVCDVVRAYGVAQVGAMARFE